MYAGSLQRVDFGEERDEKGFCIFELDPARPQSSRLSGFEFVKNSARRFLTIDVNLTAGDEDPTSTVIRAIEDEDLAEAIVRLRLALPAELETMLVESRIRDALRPAHFIASISKDVSDRGRTRVNDADTRGLTPNEALQMYFNTRNVPDDRAQVLLRYAEELIAEHQ